MELVAVSNKLWEAVKLKQNARLKRYLLCVTCVQKIPELTRVQKKRAFERLAARKRIGKVLKYLSEIPLFSSTRIVQEVPGSHVVDENTQDKNHSPALLSLLLF